MSVNISETRLGWLATLIVALVSFAISAYAAYSNNEKEINSRVTAVETQQKNDHEGIQRVEGKVDTVDRKIDRLVEWALGKK